MMMTVLMMRLMFVILLIKMMMTICLLWDFEGRKKVKHHVIVLLYSLPYALFELEIQDPFEAVVGIGLQTGFL